MKFIFDQTVGSVMNIVLFIVLINLLKGTGVWRSWELVVEVRFIILPVYCLLSTWVLSTVLPQVYRQTDRQVLFI